MRGTEPLAADAKMNASVVTANVAAIVVVVTAVVAATIAVTVARTAGGDAAHDNPAIEGAVMAVVAYAAVFRIAGVAAVVDIASAAAGLCNGGSKDAKTEDGGDEHADLFHGAGWVD